MATQTTTWGTHWNARMAWSAFVHLLHSAAILVLTLFVPGDAGAWLKYVWVVGALFSALALMLLVRVGNYEGITDEEVGQLVRRSYWVATAVYLSLLGTSLYLILRR